MVKKDHVAKAVEVIKNLDLSFTLGGSAKLLGNEDEDK
jgi:hypothetical protein